MNESSWEELPRMLSIRHVAPILGRSETAVRSLRQRGSLPPAYKIGRSLQWDKQEFQAWFKSRRESSGLGNAA